MDIRPRAFHAATTPRAVDDLQKRVYDSVRESVLATLGAGASFPVCLPGQDRYVFSTEAIAESIAWEVAVNLETDDIHSARLSF
jgi:hypothetical protein